MNLSRILRSVGMTCLVLTLMVGPFLRGLFFWSELLGALTVVAVGFSLWLLGRRLGGLTSGLPGGLVGTALLALLGFYLLQFAWAVFPRGNLDAVLRVTVGWFAFVMMRAESGPLLRKWLAWSFVLSAGAVGLLGFAEITGYTALNPELTRSLALMNLSTRMFTVFQYPNTAATYLFAALLVSVGLGVGGGLARTKSERFQRASVQVAAGGLISLLMMAFFFTISRGAIVVLPIGLFLLFLGLTGRQKWSALLLLMAGVLPALVALRGIGANAAIHNYVSAFRWIGAATAGGLASALVLVFFERLKQRLQMGLVAGALVLGVVGILVVRPSGNLLPAQAARLMDFNPRTQNVVLRLIYDQEAARIVADHPLGSGGWGWDRSYRQYQAFNWIARETHNHYAQVAVEAGVLGLGALLVALGGALWTAWRGRGDSALGWTMASGAALIAVHSTIDFNLSYGLIWLLLWVLFGASMRPALPTRFERWLPWSGLVVGIGVAALAGTLWVGARYTAEADRLEDAARHGDAVAAARTAIRYDRWDTVPLMIIGDQPALAKVIQLDPRNARAHFDLAIQLERAKDQDGALREARQAMTLQPMLSLYTNKVASLTGTFMNDAVRNGDQPEARKRAQEILTLAAQVQARKIRGDQFQHYWGAPALALDSESILRLGQALYLTGDMVGAEARLTEASKVGLLGSEGEVWLYVMYEKAGNKAKVAVLEGRPWIRFRQGNPVYKNLKAW
jgi:tetratricopeptide (TPR) repeat protein